MMTITDIRGHALSGTNRDAALAYSDAVRQFSMFSGDPVSAADRLIEAQPGFVMAHALKAWLYLLGGAPAAIPVARAAILAGESVPATTQERGHLAALGHLAAGRWHEASRVIEDVAIEHPRDLLALIAGHQLDYFTGNARLLKERIARALPNWSQDTPGRHAILAMHAFGLEENALYDQAERQGRAALAIEAGDGWARHAVAHVLEMQGRHDEGITFMREDLPSWTTDSFLAVHNWWHLALYHLELGQIDEVLALVDGPIMGGATPQIMDLIDASAMLWRLHLRGIDVGPRWHRLADSYKAGWSAGGYAFTDFHAVMAFVGAGRREMIEQTIEAQGIALLAAGDNADFTREVGYPLMRALKAFGDGHYGETVRLIRPIRSLAARFGGSNAQRDIIDLTLIEAAFRSGERSLAKALAAERVMAKHDSPLAKLFARRAGLQGCAGTSCTCPQCAAGIAA
ncbi:MAG TPA: tetratricopeptide repeat protein [Bosea sp. (in: a-proteobacteria)]|jgi:hypothetical protein|uniref:tetratricopeptide repeat protein n=1 Tax=Bosea sp. (in: a-proteobacteria) TaxID=1871050 RepID=UPI002E1380C1|nr:tetratricopeptide repeat protein [Bosea sp. (in: a-proteobacteria)]